MKINKKKNGKFHYFYSTGRKVPLKSDPLKLKPEVIHRSGFITNMAYGKGKILDKDMYMSDNDNKSAIIEDTLSRNKKHKKTMLGYVNGWENMLHRSGEGNTEFPEMMIEKYTYLSTLTYGEYKRWQKKEVEAEAREEELYAKEHPMEKEKIKKLQEAFDELNKTCDAIIIDSSVRFDMALDPVKYIGKEAYDFNVYQGLIDSFQKKYFETWVANETKEEYKERGWWPYSKE